MRTRFTLALLLAALPAAALAQDIGKETFAVRASGLFPKIDTSARADASGGQVGTSVDFESDLGLEDRKAMPSIDASWRFAPRHRLALSYLSLDRDAANTIKGEIRFGDSVFPVNAQVAGRFDSEVVAATYYYSLLQERDHEFALGLGVHATKFDAALSSSVGSVSVSKSANAPLPVLAAHFATRIAGNWQAELGAKWFGLKFGDYDGRLTVLNAAVQWYPAKHWGLEAGYAMNDYRLDVSKTSWNGSAHYKFNGPTLGLVGRF